MYTHIISFTQNLKLKLNNNWYYLNSIYQLFKFCLIWQYYNWLLCNHKLKWNTYDKTVWRGLRVYTGRSQNWYEIDFFSHKIIYCKKQHCDHFFFQQHKYVFLCYLYKRILIKIIFFFFFSQIKIKKWQLHRFFCQWRI